MNKRRLLKLAGASLVASFGAPLLLSCSDAGDGVEFHRDKRRTISSTTRFNAAQFSGKWVIRGEFVHPTEAPTYGSVAFAKTNDEISAISVYFRGKLQKRFAVKQKALGRFTAGEAPFNTEYWVLWADADYRTAAIGTPSGSFGWIIDRSSSGGADRIKAARSVLGANGYNLSRLKIR